jgi:acetyl-CoA carboxylase beta subunit
MNVCPKCGHHFRIAAAERLKGLFDDGRWTEHYPHLTSNDPLLLSLSSAAAAGAEAERVSVPVPVHGSRSSP